MLSLLKSKSLRRSAGFLALAASAVVAGCTNTETVAQQNPLETEAGFCEELAKAECSGPVVSSCYNVSMSGAGIQADTQKCITAASASNNCNPQGLTYHPEVAQDAIDEIAMIYSDGVLTSGELAQLNSALAQVFNLGEKAGSKCNIDTDCDAANGLSCILHAGKGFCGAAHVVQAGQSCAGVGATCATGNYCESAGASFACIATVKVGKSCAGSYACEAGSTCSNGVCRALAGDGASCSLATDCAAGFCIKDQSDDKIGRCFPQDKFDPFSASCDPYLPN